MHKTKFCNVKPSFQHFLCETKQYLLTTEHNAKAIKAVNICFSFWFLSAARLCYEPLTLCVV